MTNPFDAPNSQGAASAPGELDVMQAIRDGWEATQRNFLVWLGINVVAFICILVAELLCILPVFVVGPAIVWGMTKFTFDALDGEGKFESLFSGFDKLGEVVPPFLLGGLALMAGNIVMYIPVLIVMAVLGAIESEILMLVVGLPTFLVFFVAVFYLAIRLGFWAHIIVDRGMSGIDALTESWRITDGRALSIMGLYIAIFGVAIVGYIACLIGIIPASMVIAGAQASAYRQLAGRAG